MNRTIILFEIIFLVFLFTILFKIYDYTNQLYKASESRMSMFLAADKLRQSSDDLTSFARSYVVTGDKEFKFKYFTTLNIRDGIAPRPYNYRFLYWELGLKDRERKHPLMKNKSLDSIFQALPFTKEELKLLQTSKNNSDDLVNLEVLAFNKMLHHNKQEAINIMFSNKYTKAKAKIMNPIDDFIIKISKRSQSFIKELKKKIDLMINLFLIAGILFLIFNLYVYFYLKRKSEKELEEKNNLINKVNTLNNGLEKTVVQRTKEITEIHKHVKDSIEYASIIQSALMPEFGSMQQMFKDMFVFWQPKDIVGGDIYLFETLRHKDECLIMCIDCTGHGVPGAFVTMIVKAIEREVVSKLKKHSEFDISTAIIMEYFNKTMKVLLRQENEDSMSNAGFDGGIIYYNRRTQILKFTGAETSLFYVDNGGEFHMIKGDRYSVGYKKCKMDYKYKEHIIQVKEGMKFYITTDGYLDQNGGNKGFPFGKKRFGEIIKNNFHLPMNQQENIFIKTIEEYENSVTDNDRNDDMTLMAFEIGKKVIAKTIREIVKYEGVITQNVISTMMDNIQAKIENISVIGTLSTISIEYCQNMMNYSKDINKNSRKIISAGEIEIQEIDEKYYEIKAKNIISVDDKEKIEPKLIEIQLLDKAGIKKRYRELRRSGKNTHEKGGGIGIYEIAKISDKIEYRFESINNDKYYFTMISVVNIKK